MVGFPPAPTGRVTLHNWQQAPYNRWSFQNTRQVIPTATISRGRGSVWKLPQDSVDIGDIEFETPEGARMTIGHFLDNSWTDGFLVIRHGTIQFEAYRNHVSAESHHIVMSVSKSITSLVIGILADRLLIDVAAPVANFVPELAGTAFEGATIQHLLDMEVANAWHENHFDEAAEFWRLDVACGWLPPREGAALTLFDFLRRTKCEGPHGVQVQYSSLNSDLLGLIAERICGIPFPALVSRELWMPMGAEFDADITLDPGGMSVADGGYCVALRDLGRIGQLFLEGGRVGGSQVVPGWWIADCCRLNSRPFHPSSSGADLQSASYHNQWWRVNERLFALGLHGQMIAIDREAELVVVFVSSPPEPKDTMQRQTQFKIVDALS